MKKLIKIIILGLIFSVGILTGGSNGVTAKLTDNIKELKFDNLRSVRIELATTGVISSKNYTFDLNNPDQSKILKDIISRLNSARVQGYADEKVDNKGGSSTFLIIELKNGLVIKIKSAAGGKITKLSDSSTEISQFDIPNEVTMCTNSNIKPIRILSPEIKKLINSGYKNIFVGKKCDYQ